MRFDYLALGPKDDPAIIRFHSGLTVVSGMSADERDAMFELLYGALVGREIEANEARLLDQAGRGIRLLLGAGRPTFQSDDGELVAAPLTILGTGADRLRELMLVQSLRTVDDDAAEIAARADEAPELREVRTTLKDVERELEAGLSIRAQAETSRGELASIEERLRQAEEGGAKRRYARLLGDLERVRVEAASLRGGTAVADADRAFIASGGEVHFLADRWRAAGARLLQQREQFGDRERLDPRTLTEALETPDKVPPELDALAAQYESAEARRTMLSERLTSLASDHLPDPSHPAVVRLAHTDQDLVWETAHRAVDAAQRLEGQSIALGGLEAEGVAPSVLAELEVAHDEVDRAERLMIQRRKWGVAGIFAGVLMAVAGVISTPLLMLVGVVVVLVTGLWALGLPKRALAAARANELAVLERTGGASYLGFQLRRLEVTINPSATEPLELAALEYRRALADWRELAGDLAPSEALALEVEVRAYAQALSALRGAADQIAEVRHQLVNEAEPAAETARTRLLAACAPFGIKDPNLAVELVRHQATTSSHARLQFVLEEVEAEVAKAEIELGERLAVGGYVDGALADRLDAFDRARSEAIARDRARANARPTDVVEADLSRLESAVRAEHRPEWGTSVTSADGEEPDVDLLKRHREEAMAAYTLAKETVPDIERLVDRRDALARRIAVLEIETGGASGTGMDANELEQRLVSRLALARRVGPAEESIPVVLSEPFAEIHGDRKWALLDAVERLAGSIQLAYLTDDVDTILWARRRAAVGALTLLEPVADPVG